MLSFPLRFRMACGVVLLALVSGRDGTAQEPYRTADEAFAAGARFLREQNFAGSREPLEAALRLAPDDKYRLRVYDALIPAYRQLPEPDKMVGACEFIIEHADTKAKRSITARTLVSFLLNRGLIDEAIQRYEENLQAAPEDIVPLTMLTIIYERPKRHPERLKDLQPRLAAIDSRLAAEKAAALEAAAKDDPQTAAWNWKDAAVAWVEAGDNNRAAAAADQSLSAAPETRTGILNYQWRMGLGDVYRHVERPEDAAVQYEAAIQAAPGDVLKRQAQEKLAAVRPPA